MISNFDPSHLSQEIINILQPYLPIFAAKAADALGAETPKVVRNLWGSIQKRVKPRSKLKQTINETLNDPQNNISQDNLRKQLEILLNKDKGFAEEIRNRVKSIHQYKFQQNNISIKKNISGNSKKISHQKGSTNFTADTIILSKRYGAEISKQNGDIKSDDYRIKYPLQNLTSPPNLFLGRKNELDEVLGRLRPAPFSRTHKVLIHGVGGIGKTTLALQAANYFIENYHTLKANTKRPNEEWFKEQYEVVVWVSAQNERLTPEGINKYPSTITGLDDICKALATVLNRRDIQQAPSPEERQDLVARALSEKRSLLIIDNFELLSGDNKLALFLRDFPYPSKVIVTSRENTLTEAYPIALGPLSKEVCETLIQEECKKHRIKLENSQVQKLIEGTGGVPLAIVWCVGTMARFNDIDSTLERLKDPQNEPARFCFELSMEKIKGTIAHRLLMSLAVFKTSANPFALATVAGLEKKQFTDGLQNLEKLSLINHNQTDDRYDMLPLTKEYVLTELDKYQETAREIKENWVNYYASLRDRVADSEIGWTIFTDYKPDKLDFKPEMDNIMDVIQYCLEPNSKYWRFAAKILDDFRAPFFAYGYWNERDQFAHKIIAIADREDDIEIVGRTQRLLAWIQCFRDNYKESSMFAQASLKNAQLGISNSRLTLKQKEPYWQTKYKALTTLGHIALREEKFGIRKSKDFTIARRYFLQAKRIIQKHYHRELFICNLYLAQVEYDARAFDKSKKLLDSVLQTARNRQHKRVEALALYYLAKIERRGYGNYNLATWYFDQSLEIAEQNEDKPLMARIWFAKGQLEAAKFHENKNHNEHRSRAIILIEQAVKSFNRLGMQSESKDAKKFLIRRLNYEAE